MKKLTILKSRFPDFDTGNKFMEGLSSLIQSNGHLGLDTLFEADGKVMMTLWANHEFGREQVIEIQHIVSQQAERYLNSHFPTLFDGEAVMGVFNGWFSILIDLFEKINGQCKITDIKSKFGSLRVYTHPTNAEIEAFIDHAGEMSEKTCEICGKAGKLVSFHSRCKEHSI